MPPKDLYAQKLKALRSELGSTTRLLIVSKNRSAQDIKAYYELGQRDFGENRVQELTEKARTLLQTCPEIRWHMIGHLQTNKIHHLFAVPHLYAIHSVDDRECVEKLLRSEERLSHEVGIFLQFNTSHEQEKFGFETYTELVSSAELLLRSKRLKLLGLMTMGTLRTEDFEAEAGRCFQDLNVEKEKLEAEFGIKLMTSMGMSQDYRIAIREKSDWIRLGTVMFS
jgi:pyridoxal phosphate enzyme (YggS family)